MDLAVSLPPPGDRHWSGHLLSGAKYPRIKRGTGQTFGSARRDLEQVCKKAYPLQDVAQAVSPLSGDSDGPADNGSSDKQA